MLPLVVYGLNEDLYLYGRCTYSVQDDELEFSIKRHNPMRDYYTLEIV